MDHITAALDGVSEARLQVLLGLPLMPWSLRGQARAARPASICARRLTEVVKDRLPGGGPDDFLGRLIRALHDKFDAGRGAGARGRQCRDLLPRRPRDHRQCDHLDPVPALRAAGAAGRGGGGGARRRWRRARTMPSCPSGCRLLRRDPRGGDAPLSAGAALRPPGGGRRPLGGEAVAAGDIVSIWPWLIHRHQALWDDPDVFDPERLRPEAKAARHRFQYLPFGGGPRLCVGMRFATDRGADRARALARRVALRARRPGREVRASGMVTLRPAGGLPLRLARRA